MRPHYILMPSPNNAFAYSSYALPNIENLSITQDVTRHCHRFRKERPGSSCYNRVVLRFAPFQKNRSSWSWKKNAVFRSANAKRLRAAGFEVLEAANSAEVELILKSTTVDALFVPVRRG